MNRQNAIELWNILYDTPFMGAAIGSGCTMALGFSDDKSCVEGIAKATAFLRAWADALEGNKATE